MRSLIAGSALAFALAAPAAAADFVVIRLEAPVNRPPAQVWARIGGYCGIAEWAKLRCQMTTGDGHVGSMAG